jgi:hypothetical protein
MSGLNVTIVPVPEASEHARGPASHVRVYASIAAPGMVSVVLYGSKGRGFDAGTRLTREQVAALRDDLDAYLKEPTP